MVRNLAVLPSVSEVCRNYFLKGDLLSDTEVLLAVQNLKDYVNNHLLTVVVLYLKHLVWLYKNHDVKVLLDALQDLTLEVADFVDHWV